MPLSSSALAMSTFSLPPSNDACGAGCSTCTAAKAACTVSCCEGPIAEPIQLAKLRCASASTASLQPRDGER